MQTSEEPQQPFTLSSEKIFYKIGEVSRITGLETHVIRYWESMFPNLRPKKGKSGQRVYQKRDIELILYIKHLQEVEGYTIEGIRRRLGRQPNFNQEIPPRNPCHTPSKAEIISFIRSRLIDIIDGIK